MEWRDFIFMFLIIKICIISAWLYNLEKRITEILEIVKKSRYDTNLYQPKVDTMSRQSKDDA